MPFPSPRLAPMPSWPTRVHTISRSICGVAFYACAHTAGVRLTDRSHDYNQPAEVVANMSAHHLTLLKGLQVSHHEREMSCTRAICSALKYRLLRRLSHRTRRSARPADLRSRCQRLWCAHASSGIAHIGLHGAARGRGGGRIYTLQKQGVDSRSDQVYTRAFELRRSFSGTPGPGGVPHAGE